MTSNRWDAWEPQEPPEGFARRTVDLVLREPPRRRRVLGVRWIRVAAAAAMLFGGAAWGFSAWSRDRGSAPVVPIAPRAASRPAPSAPPALSHPLDLADTESPAPVAAPSMTARPRRPRVRAPEISAPDAGRKVIVPTCDCAPDQVLCSCF